MSKVSELTNFKVTFSVNESDIQADVSLVVGKSSGKCNILRGQAALDLYNAMTGESLTLDDIKIA